MRAMPGVPDGTRSAPLAGRRHAPSDHCRRSQSPVGCRPLSVELQYVPVLYRVVLADLLTVGVSAPPQSGVFEGLGDVPMHLDRHVEHGLATANRELLRNINEREAILKSMADGLLSLIVSVGIIAV